MNRWACHLGILDFGAGLSDLRDRKNEVRITSNLSPCVRKAARARGTFGVSMKPNRRVARENPFDMRSIEARSLSSTRESFIEPQIADVRRVTRVAYRFACQLTPGL